LSVALTEDHTALKWKLGIGEEAMPCLTTLSAFTIFFSRSSVYLQREFVQRWAICIISECPNGVAVDHVQSTLATAQQAGVMSLARLWWREAFPAANLGELVNYEIGQQAIYLAQVWNSASEEVLVGVGDQLTASGDLLMYEDFGSADFALQVKLASAVLRGLGLNRFLHPPHTYSQHSSRLSSAG
jgi:hypothetical protein